MEIERAKVLAIVMLGCACQGGAAPLVDAEPSADAAPSTTPPPAKPERAVERAAARPSVPAAPERKAEPERTAEVTPPAPPEPTPFDTTTSIASRGGASLPSTVTKEEILRAWPGVTLRTAKYVDDGIIVVGPDREPLLHLFHDQACFTGRGVVDPTGIEVGMPLDEVPGMELVLCEVATSADLLMRSEPCPRYDRSDIVLVCDLRADRAHRIFFDLGPEHLARAGEELRRADLAVLGNPRVDAISLTTGLRGPLGPAEGEPSPTPPPASATGPSGAVVVLARTSDAPPHELRTDTLATPAAIEAALPGFTTRSIRYGGIAILRDGARIASTYPGSDGYISTVNLDGPGLVDVNGIGADARFDDVAAVPGLTCVGMIDEGSPGYVECTVPSTGSSYTFDLHAHIEMEPLTLAQAKKKVGKRKAAVGISRPEAAGGSP